MTKEKKIYITFYNNNNVFDRKLNYAIICNNVNQAIDIAMDINSYACFKNVRINRSGKFNKKDIEFIKADEYRQFFDGGISFVE